MATQKKEVSFILTYLLEWLTGIIFYLVAGDKNPRLKFHAMQAILLGLAAIVLTWVVGLFAGFAAEIVALIIWIYGMYVGYQAYEGTDIVVPVLGDYAKQFTK